MRLLRRNGDLHHGSDQRGRDAMPGNIGDQYPESLLVNAQKIVEVSSYFRHR